MKYTVVTLALLAFAGSAAWADLSAYDLSPGAALSFNSLTGKRPPAQFMTGAAAGRSSWHLALSDTPDAGSWVKPFGVYAPSMQATLVSWSDSLVMAGVPGVRDSTGITVIPVPIGDPRQDPVTGPIITNPVPAPDSVVFALGCLAALALGRRRV